jgi:hypothetical protein
MQVNRFGALKPVATLACILFAGLIIASLQDVYLTTYDCRGYQDDRRDVCFLAQGNPEAACNAQYKREDAGGRIGGRRFACPPYRSVISAGAGTPSEIMSDAVTDR